MAPTIVRDPEKMTVGSKIKVAAGELDEVKQLINDYQSVTNVFTATAGIESRRAAFAIKRAGDDQPAVQMAKMALAESMLDAHRRMVQARETMEQSQAQLAENHGIDPSDPSKGRWNLNLDGCYFERIA